MAHRTIEPGLSFFGACDVRVALMPVGQHIPKDVFDAYARALHKRRHVPLSQVRLYYSEAQGKSPFPNMPWSLPAACMRLRLLPAAGDAARRRSRLADLHAGRKVVAVLGVAAAASALDAATLRAELQAACRAFPEATVSRCLVFGAEGGDSGENGGDGDDGALVFVPSFSSLDAAVASFAAAVLQDIERAVLASGPSSVRMPSPYVDGPDFAAGGGAGAGAGVGGAAALASASAASASASSTAAAGASADPSGAPAPSTGALASLAAALGAGGGGGGSGVSVGAALSSAVVAAALGSGGGAQAAANPSAPPPPPTPLQAQSSFTTATPGAPAGPLEEALRARLAHGGGGGSFSSVGGTGAPGAGTGGGSSNSSNAAAVAAAAAAAASAVDDEQQLREKRRWGRLQKAKGDLALMAGSPRDAGQHYRSGADLSRAAGDAVWAAAGLEGLAVARLAEALLLMRPSKAPAVAEGNGGEVAAADEHAAEDPAAAATTTTSSPTVRRHQPSSSSAFDAASAAASDAAAALLPPDAQLHLEAEVRALCADAARQYGRRSGAGAAALQAELALRLARLLATARGKAARHDVLALTSAAMDALPLLASADDRVVALAEAAHSLGLAGCARKRRLLLWQAGDQCRLLPPDITQAGRVALRTLAMALGQGEGEEAGAAATQKRDDRHPRLLHPLLDSSPAPGLLADDGAGCGSVSGTGSTATAAANGSANGNASQLLLRLPSSPSAGGGDRKQHQQTQPQHWALVLRDGALAAQSALLEAAPDERLLLLQQQQQQQEPSPVGVGAGGSSASLAPPLHPWLPGTSYSASPLPNFPPPALLRQKHHALAAPLCALEALLGAARRAGSAEESWEAAAALLRLHASALPAAQQAAVADVLAQAAASLHPSARARLSEGPGPLAALVRVAPAPPALRAFVDDGAADDGGGSGRQPAEAAAPPPTADAPDQGPFIFDAMAAARRKREGHHEQQQGGERGVPTAADADGNDDRRCWWVCGDEGAVEVDLCNPAAVPLRLDDLRLDLEWASEEGEEGEQEEEEGGDQHEGEASRGVGAGGGNSSGGGAALMMMAPRPAPGVSTPALSLTLPPGYAPVRVALSATPQRRGVLRVRGLLASCWGVTWRVPLLPTAAGGAGGSGAARSSSSFSSALIRVLPRLPLLRAVLQGPDGLHVARPSEGELTASPLLLLTAAASAATATSAGGAAAATAPLPSSDTAPTALAPAVLPPPPSAAAVAAAGLTAAPVVVGSVLEGQRARWALRLTNASRSAARRVRVSVVRGGSARARAFSSSSDAVDSWPCCSAGVPVVPDGFVGAHLLVGPPEAEGGGGGADSPVAAAAASGEAGVDSACLALLPPGRSAIVPLTLLVGRAPGQGDKAGLESTALVVRVTYTGAGGGGEEDEEEDEEEEDGGAAGDPSDLLAVDRARASSPRRRRQNLLRAHAPGSNLARALTIALRFDVQPSLVLARATFLAAPAPLVGGVAPSAANAAPSWPAARIDGQATTTSPPLGLGRDVFLELALGNGSDRYLRAWVAPLVAAGAARPVSGLLLPGSPGAPQQRGGGGSLAASGAFGAGLLAAAAESAESAVAVLQPGDDGAGAALLLAALSRAAASGGGEAAAASAAPLSAGGAADLKRLAAEAAARVSSRLALCWEAIMGDGERAQRGVLRLPVGMLAEALLQASSLAAGAGDAAAAATTTTATPPPPPPPPFRLATGALAKLVPPSLRLAVELVGANAPVALADVTDDLRRLGVGGVAGAAGGGVSGGGGGGNGAVATLPPAALARARAYGVRASPGDVLQLRVAVTLAPQPGEEEQQAVRLSVGCRRLGGSGGASGVLLSGALHGAEVRLLPESTGALPFGAVCLEPGAYEFGVTEVSLPSTQQRPVRGDASAAATDPASSSLLPGGSSALEAGRPSPPGDQTLYLGHSPLLLVVIGGGGAGGD